MNIYTNSDITLVPALFIIFLNILFGANAVAIKLTLNGMGPFTTAGARFAIAAVAIACWAFFTHRSFKIKKDQLVPLLIISILFTIQLSLFYLGLVKTLVSRGVLIVNLLPFIVLFLSHFFIPGDRITIRKLLGIAMGFVGVAFIFGSSQAISRSARSGDFILFAAVFLWSCNTVYIKRIIHNFAPFQLVLYPMIFSVPLFLLQGLLWDAPMVIRLDTTVLGALAYQSLVTAAFGFVAWNTLLQKYGAGNLHSFVFVMPVSGVLLSGLILNDPITANILFALVLITTGIIMVHVKPGKPTFTLPPGRGL